MTDLLDPRQYRPGPGSHSGRVIVVTGAGDGIGRAVSIALAAQGATVALLGKTQRKLVRYQPNTASGTWNVSLPAAVGAWFVVKFQDTYTFATDPTYGRTVTKDLTWSAPVWYDPANADPQLTLPENGPTATPTNTSIPPTITDTPLPTNTTIPPAVTNTPLPTNTPTNTPTPLPLPAAPTNLTATANFKYQINLSWTDNSNNETGFRIERSKGSTCTNFALIATVGANVTSFSNTKLTANTTYRRWTYWDSITPVRIGSR